MNENPLEPAGNGPLPKRPPLAPLRPPSNPARIPTEKRERFSEVAMLLEEFGQTHLDPELTGFTLELWQRLCRRQTTVRLSNGLLVSLEMAKRMGLVPPAVMPE